MTDAAADRCTRASVFPAARSSCRSVRSGEAVSTRRLMTGRVIQSAEIAFLEALVRFIVHDPNSTMVSDCRLA